MAADDALLSVYTAELIALSDSARAPLRLQGPDVRRGHAVSPVCGSTVDIDLILENGLILQIGSESEACALTRAVIAVLRDAAPGLTRAKIEKAGHDLAALLAGTGDGPSGPFLRLRALSSVRDFPARHNALMLPFVATLRAFDAAPPP